MLAAQPRDRGTTAASGSSADAAREELDEALDPQAEAALESEQAPAVSDPGSSMLVTSIMRSMDEGTADADHRVLVQVRTFRNQSHATADEVEQASNRLARLLDRAGRSHRMRFVAKHDEADGPATHHLHATAYLVTANGFDQWELYMRLTPADENWTVWGPRRPIRMLRQDRAGVQQVFVPPGLVATSGE